MSVSKKKYKESRRKALQPEKFIKRNLGSGSVRGFILLFLIILCSSCSKDLKNINDLRVYLNEPANGLVQSKSINGLLISMQYLPPQYLACKEIGEGKGVSASYKDSILQTYSNSLTFMLSIAPDKSTDKKGDIMVEGIEDYAAYVKRVLTMNFEIAQYICLKTAKQSYVPVLTNLENTYGLTEKRNIIIVFVLDKSYREDLENSESWDLVYRDELFKLGINHFVFSKRDIDKLKAALN